MEDNKIIVTDEDGKEHEMEIMFTFERGKKYVIYFDPKDPSEDLNVFASIYDEKFHLYPITDDKEYDMIEEVIEAFLEEKEKQSEDK